MHVWCGSGTNAWCACLGSHHARPTPVYTCGVCVCVCARALARPVWSRSRRDHALSPHAFVGVRVCAVVCFCVWRRPCGLWYVWVCAHSAVFNQLVVVSVHVCKGLDTHIAVRCQALPAVSQRVRLIGYVPFVLQRVRLIVTCQLKAGFIILGV